MVTYLYDMCVCSSDSEVVIAAEITDATGSRITEGCALKLYDAYGNYIYTAYGDYELTGEWNFVIPYTVTGSLTAGKYLYCIEHEESEIQFRMPIYFI